MSEIGLNKTIAKNTIMLYIRMFLMMCINLYTGRVVLATLGFEDYGIYNVVGGFVMMFSMVSAAMVGATQRFLSFELGKKDGDVGNVFRTTVSIHFILAAIILLLGETIGLWIVNNWLNFSPARYYAANWVYQFSLLAFIINIISIPYNAVIVAHEKMSAFAYISIIEAILKLLIVFLLQVLPFDKLICYGILLAIVSITIRLVYTSYCHRHFEETSYKWTLDKRLTRTILSYTGWNFLGAWAGTFRGQGVNMVINMFFGAVVNAAQGVSSHIQSAVTGLVSNFQMAMNPQIIKRYAAGEKASMFLLIFSGGRLSAILYMIMAVPLFIEAPFVLDLWLKDVPEYSVIFLRIILCTSFIDSLSRNLVTAIQASGKVMAANITLCLICVFSIPISYAFFKMGYPPYYAQITLLLISFLCLVARICLLKYIMNFPVSAFLLKVCLRALVVSAIYFSIGSISFKFLSLAEEGIIPNLLYIFIIVVFGIIIGFFGGFERAERKVVINKIMRK